MLDKIKAALTRPNVGSSRVALSASAIIPPNPSGPTVIQVVRTYLPLPENWIYEQVLHLERYHSVFATKATANLGKFPYNPIYSVSKSPLHVRLLDREIRKRAGYSPYFSEVIRLEKASILHAHGGGIATFVVRSAHRSNVPMVVSFYGTDMWKHPDGVDGLRQKYAEVFRLGALFIAEGPAAAAQLVRIGCAENRIAIHRLGVDVGAIPLKPRSLDDGGKLKVLMASRFVEKKGIPYAIEAFSRVAHDNPGIRLTVVGDSGSSKDARVRKEIEATALKHGVSDQVTILGFMGREKLRELAEQHHILLHPSVQAKTGDSEGGHPVVMTMLAASGMPILATRHCDIPEIVRDGETGWLVAERNSDEIEAALRRIVSDPSELSSFGHAARKLVEAKYDIRSIRLDPIYD
ncbi:MAG TPA: glycosyltransferase, partial [Gemmatimonadaceae bacterium]|nr:glycosyltransferase [Gemmatimonadaceae bacterium]